MARSDRTPSGRSTHRNVLRLQSVMPPDRARPQSYIRQGATGHRMALQ